MSRHPQWNYVQARLQARHGERPLENDWRALEAAHSLDHFIERARATSLRRFTDAMNMSMSSHAIERALRAAWRGYVAEVAAWVPREWRAAVLWAAYVPDLPAIDAWLKGDVQDWMRRDPVVTDLIDGSKKTALAPLTVEGGGTTVARWQTHWRLLWPQKQKAESRLLRELPGTVGAHFTLLAKAGPQESSGRYRHELAHAVTRLFRHHPAAPIAVFSHLILMALDLERLRGGLVRRRLFHLDHVRRAA